MYKFDRGTVWWVELPLRTHSHIQGGPRPCVIVSNPYDRTGVVTVCPLSTKIDEIETHPKVNIKKEGQILVEQITTIDISSLGKYAGTLSEEEMVKLNDALIMYLTTPSKGE